MRGQGLQAARMRLTKVADREGGMKGRVGEASFEAAMSTEAELTLTAGEASEPRGPRMVVDLRGREEMCGASPVNFAIRALKELPLGGELEVLTGVREQTFTLVQWARKNGYEVCDLEESGREARIRFRRRAAKAAGL